MRRGTRVVGLLMLLLLLARPEPAYAYVDPGTASYAFQVVAGALLGGMFLVKTHWGKLKDSVRKGISRVRGTRT
jgi:hypothetical protein